MRWQHALAVSEVKEGYLSKRSLVDFRRRLYEHDANGARIQKLFERVGAAAIADMGLSIRKQRLDSTFIQSNIAKRGRLALMTEALRRLVAELSAQDAQDIPADVLAWWRKDEGWGQTPSAEAVIEWLQRTLQVASAPSEAGELARRILDEQTEPEPEPPSARSASSQSDAKRKQRNRRKKNKKGSKRRRMKAKTAPDSIHSLHDLDANRGRKGTGYLVQVAETAGNEGQPEVITVVDVLAANASDRRVPIGLLEALAERELQPETLFVDAGYTRGDNLLAAASLGTDLYGPVQRRRSNDKLHRTDFVFDETGHVTACPAGLAPIDHTTRKEPHHGRLELYARFKSESCSVCELRSRCPVKQASGGRHGALSVSLSNRVRDERQRVQQTPEWREPYQLRAGIEATNSELKRAHGLKRPTVRGLRKIRQRVLLKAIACNAKRWARARHRALEDEAASSADVSPSAHVITLERSRRTASTERRSTASPLAPRHLSLAA